jgi:hypothetical protein
MFFPIFNQCFPAVHVRVIVPSPLDPSLLLPLGFNNEANLVSISYLPRFFTILWRRLREDYLCTFELKRFNIKKDLLTESFLLLVLFINLCQKCLYLFFFLLLQFVLKRLN